MDQAQQVVGFDIDVINGSRNPVPRVRDAGDDSLWVVFEMFSHFDDVATREKGRAIFEMREYIKIIVPGDTSTIIHREVRDSDRERFPRQYLAFKANTSQQQGIPLKGWPHLNPAQVDELAYFKITTVEALSTVSDANCQKFTGLNELREKAKKYLEQMKSEAPFERVQAELAQRDEKISAQSTELEILRNAIAELRAANTKKGVSEDKAA